MKNTDLIIADNMIHLDKVYPVRYSMRSIYRMECRYGSVDAALERLRHYENIGVFLGDFAYIKADNALALRNCDIDLERQQLYKFCKLPKEILQNFKPSRN